MNIRPVGQGPVGVDGGLGSLVGFGLLAAAAWSLVSLFWISLVMGVFVVAFIIFCFWTFSLVDELPSTQRYVTYATMLLAVLGAVLLYPLTIDNRVISFPLAAWTITALFAVGITSAWQAMTALMRILAFLFTATLATYLVVFPTPSGASDPDDKESEWKIELKVVDETGEALKSALAQCDAVMLWDDDQPVRFDRHFAQTTDDEGIARFTFHEDTRLKVAVCSALKQSDDVVWMEPSDEVIARADYPLKSTAMASPLPGGDYKLTLRLEPRPGFEREPK